jgi:hypothetical protein
VLEPASARALEVGSAELTDHEIWQAHGLTADQDRELRDRLKASGPAYAAFLRKAHTENQLGFLALLHRAQALTAPTTGQATEEPATGLDHLFGGASE